MFHEASKPATPVLWLNHGFIAKQLSLIYNKGYEYLLNPNFVAIQHMLRSKFHSRLVSSRIFKDAHFIE
jgi:phenolic acid decarboxylase